MRSTPGKLDGRAASHESRLQPRVFRPLIRGFKGSRSRGTERGVPPTPSFAVYMKREGCDGAFKVV